MLLLDQEIKTNEPKHCIWFFLKAKVNYCFVTNGSIVLVLRLNKQMKSKFILERSFDVYKEINQVYLSYFSF